MQEILDRIRRIWYYKLLGRPNLIPAPIRKESTISPDSCEHLWKLAFSGLHNDDKGATNFYHCSTCGLWDKREGEAPKRRQTRGGKTEGSIR